MMHRRALFWAAPALALAALGVGVAVASGQGEGRLTGPELEEMLKAANLKYVPLEGAKGNAFILPFESENIPELAVVVQLSEKGEFVSIYAPIMKVPADAPAEFYRYLLSLNDKVWQAKFAISRDGDLYFCFEVPSRLLDVRELAEDVYITARFVDKTFSSLKRALSGEVPGGEGAQT